MIYNIYKFKSSLITTNEWVSCIQCSNTILFIKVYASLHHCLSLPFFCFLLFPYPSPAFGELHFVNQFSGSVPFDHFIFSSLNMSLHIPYKRKKSSCASHYAL